MGLITKEVLQTWNKFTKKHYLNLGYPYTKIGDSFWVKVEHLMNGSHAEIKIECDECHKILNGVPWRNYLKYKKENLYYCNDCAKKLYGGNNCKNIIQFSLDNKIINIFKSATEANKKTGINYSCISECCNGKRETAGHFKWKFRIR